MFAVLSPRLSLLVGLLATVLLLLAISSVSGAQSPAPTPTSQGQIGANGTYGVVAGDTLFGIANRYNVTVAQMLSANGLDGTATLAVGQRLHLPGTQAAPLPSADSAPARADAQGTGGGATHVVAAGETLFSIARAQGVSVSALSAQNQIADPRQISVGQVLLIPSQASTLPPASTPGDAAVAAPPLAQARSHTVAAGQTLFSIAREHAVDVNQLATLNGLTDPSQIYVGQVLQISAAQEVGAVTVAAGVNNPPSEVYLESVQNVPVPEDRTAVATVPTAPTPTPMPAAQPSRPAVTSAPTTAIMLPSPPPRRGSKFHWPARGKILTRYGSQGNGQVSDGIEIEVRPGARILAADDGVVAFAGTGVAGLGYLVLIKHADNYYTTYSQNSAVTVARGQVVSRGETIAQAGTRDVGVAGRLHFEVRHRQNPVNPLAHMAN